MSLSCPARGARHLPVLLVLIASLLTGCGDGESEGDAVATETVTETVAETASTGAPSSTTAVPSPSTTAEASPTSAGAAPDVATVEALAQAVFADVTECPNGSFREADDLLTTLSEEYAARATTLHSYVCGGRIDQVVYAVMPDEATAAEALDPAGEAVSNAPAWVAGNVVVAMNYGVEEDGVDIAGFFQQLTATCGCGETRYQG